ncbi:thymidylate synthase [Pandoraea terrae]|uniref:Thymidylate synthase n=1 Tax=Pandoraea terrae TaxID=1537710 RepID=A0A5E4ZFM0_9BURK|nr:thymidylate synthase [Pandoraea terrae]VVE59648.1 thymidylate synthase [Pandoraea terrae]
MQQYHDLIRDILKNGSRKMDRTGTGTVSVFGRQMRFDLKEGFPLVTTKRIHLKSVIHELLWFIAGDTNVKYLNDNGVTIWDEWADENGNLGPVYGHQWRFWPKSNGETIDQISNLVTQIRARPNSRRLMLTAMNVAEFPDESMSPVDNVHAGRMALAPCHAFAQVAVNDGKLSCLLYCRSQDVFLGTPFNIASYALFTHMLAQQCGLDVGELIWTGGDCHLYLNHLEQVNIQLEREPFPLPKLKILRKPDSILDYRYEDFEIENYQYHPGIKAPIAV